MLSNNRNLMNSTLNPSIIDDALGLAANCSIKDYPDMERAIKIFFNFMESGNNYQSTISKGNNCLNDALYCGALWKDLTCLLMKRGADPHQENGLGLTALNYFIYLHYKQDSTVTKLISCTDNLKKLLKLIKRNNINALPVLEAADCYGMFMQNPELINSRYYPGSVLGYYNLLHIAVIFQSDEVVKFLIDRGANPLQYDSENHRPCYYARYYNKQSMFPMLETIQDKEVIFSLSDKLGKGTYGKVYKGKIRQTEVAVKLCENAGYAGEERSRYEAKIHGYFQHPNIVKYICTIERYNVFGIVTEYCNNKTLTNFIETNDFATIKKCFPSLVLQMNAGLKYLHGFGYVHLDFTPNNIFLHKQGEDQINLRIGDFGATEMKGEVRPCDVTTYTYCSPERFYNSKPYQFENDFFSFGVVMGYMETRQKPWSGSSKKEDIRPFVIKGERATFNKVRMRKKVAELVVWCWEQNPILRPNCDDIEAYIRKRF